MSPSCRNRASGRLPPRQQDHFHPSHRESNNQAPSERNGDRRYASSSSFRISGVRTRLSFRRHFDWATALPTAGSRKDRPSWLPRGGAAREQEADRADPDRTPYASWTSEMPALRLAAHLGHADAKRRRSRRGIEAPEPGEDERAQAWRGEARPSPRLRPRPDSPADRRRERLRVRRLRRRARGRRRSG